MSKDHGYPLCSCLTCRRARGEIAQKPRTYPYIGVYRDGGGKPLFKVKFERTCAGRVVWTTGEFHRVGDWGDNWAEASFTVETSGADTLAQDERDPLFGGKKDRQETIAEMLTRYGFGKPWGMKGPNTQQVGRLWRSLLDRQPHVAFDFGSGDSSVMLHYDIDGAGDIRVVQVDPFITESYITESAPIVDLDDVMERYHQAQEAALFTKYPFLRPVNEYLKDLIRQRDELQASNTKVLERARRAERRIAELEARLGDGA